MVCLTRARIPIVVIGWSPQARWLSGSLDRLVWQMNFLLGRSIPPEIEQFQNAAAMPDALSECLGFFLSQSCLSFFVPRLKTAMRLPAGGWMFRADTTDRQPMEKRVRRGPRLQPV
jgi:hypothetical protein